VGVTNRVFKSFLVKGHSGLHPKNRTLWKRNVDRITDYEIKFLGTTSGYTKREHERNGAVLDKLKIKQTNDTLRSELSEEMRGTEKQNEYRKNPKKISRH
jgi:hypothetical protein